MKSIQSIKCYSDVFSAHCWFAFEALIQQQTIRNYQLEFIPVHAASIMSDIGLKMPYYEKALRDFNFYDIQSVGKVYGLDIKLPSNAMDKLSNIGTFNSMRLAAAVKELDPDNQVPVWRSLFKRMWSDDKPLNDISDFEEIVEETKTSEKVLQSLADKRWTLLLKQNNQQVIDQGGFGVPWIQAIKENGDSECFFGADRIPLIWKYLDSSSQQRKRPC